MTIIEWITECHTVMCENYIVLSSMADYIVVKHGNYIVCYAGYKFYNELQTIKYYNWVCHSLSKCTMYTVILY